MTFDFETFVSREHTGNMKGGMREELPADAVFLSGAEADYPTAPCIRGAAARFAGEGIYGFTLPDARYREKISFWTELSRGWRIDTDSIVPTLGTIFGLSTAIRAFTAPGDGVIIQRPSYSRFDRAVLRNGRRVVPNPMIEENGAYRLDLTDLADKMACPENSLLILCNPHNPTGKVFSEQELTAIARLARQSGTVVFSDEIFAETAQPGHPAVPYVKLDPEHGITSFSLGKAFSLTGINHANLIIPNRRLRGLYQSRRDAEHFGSIDPFFYQALTAAYSEDGWVWVQAMNRHNAANYRLLERAAAEQMPLLRLSPLEGTSVCWLDLRGLGMDGRQRKHFLEQEAMVYGDPGEEYGPEGSGFVRLNLATPSSYFQKGVNQLIRAYTERRYLK